MWQVTLKMSNTSLNKAPVFLQNYFSNLNSSP